MSMKKALICGISGQDGSYLAKFLLEKGYEVIGTSRDAENSTFSNLHKMGIFNKVKIYSASLNDFRSIIQVLKNSNPDEIYNLSGQSSVGLSFQQPVETFSSITIGTINLLEAVRILNPSIKVYNAASCECFGDTKGHPADENTPFSPRSPYAVAKSAAYWYVANYRESYNIFACSGILFNHESKFRHDRYVTQKIISSVKNISQGKESKLQLGNINIQRDWGWAPEYVTAMYLMLQNNMAVDYVIATGVKSSLIDFISIAFSYYNLHYQDFLEINNELKRPTDIEISYGNPIKAKNELGWEAKTTLKEIIINMIEEK
jgi:GDPmannose 4,6-dehydratase